MGWKDIHFEAFLTAVAAVLSLTPGAIATRVSYWEAENQIEKRLEHIPGDTSGIVSSKTLTERLKHVQPELNANLPFSKSDPEAAQTGTGASPAGLSDMPHEMHQVGLVDDETLIPIPSLTWEHVSSSPNPSTIGPQGVAVPLPYSAWTGFTCLGGIAGFYFLKNVRRLLS